MPAPQKVLLLPLDTRSAGVIVDALVAYATQCENKPGGDLCGYAPVCDELADRIRPLLDMAHADTHELIRSWRARDGELGPQG